MAKAALQYRSSLYGNSIRSVIRNSPKRFQHSAGTTALMAYFCTTCGTALEAGSNAIKCPQHRANFCIVCGVKLSADSAGDKCPQHQKPNVVYRQGDMYCTSCGSVGQPQTLGLVELLTVGVLSMAALLIPLIIFLVVKGGKRCHQCGQKTLIPVTSPIARAALR